ncbi:MAG: diguanylate cyclase, partial [Clostridiales bacterium]
MSNWLRKKMLILMPVNLFGRCILCFLMVICSVFVAVNLLFLYDLNRQGGENFSANLLTKATASPNTVYAKMAEDFEIVYSCTLITLFIVFLLLFFMVIGLLLREQKRERQDAERLWIGEEQYRIALAHSKLNCFRYDVRSKTITIDTDVKQSLGLPQVVKNVPWSMIEDGTIAAESAEDVLRFYQAMFDGSPHGELVFRIRDASGVYVWHRMEYTLIYDSEKKPLYSIVVYEDITRQREKELAYERWRQKTEAMPKEKISLLEWNMTRDVAEAKSGALIALFQKLPMEKFDALMEAYGQNKVYAEDKPEYLKLVSRERLIGAFLEGIPMHQMDFREINAGGNKWMHIEVQLVRYADTGELKAFILIKDIDEEKQQEMRLRIRSRQDALTGLLNRLAFTEEVEKLFFLSAPGVRHAFMMIDLDYFKQVNDTYGHLEGDRVLFFVADKLKTLLRNGDLLGRIGGDEFILCLKDIPNNE